MLWILAIATCYFLQETTTKKYIKIQHKEPAKLVVNKAQATDFVPFQIADTPTEFVLKAKKQELYLDVLDENGTIGGNKIVPESKNFISILFDSNFAYQLKTRTGTVFYDVKTNLVKLSPFVEETHKGFDIISRKTDKHHVELLKDRAKDLRDLKNKYEAKERELTPDVPAVPAVLPAEIASSESPGKETM